MTSCSVLQFPPRRNCKTEHDVIGELIGFQGGALLTQMSPTAPQALPRLTPSVTLPKRGSGVGQTGSTSVQFRNGTQKSPLHGKGVGRALTREKQGVSGCPETPRIQLRRPEQPPCPRCESGYGKCRTAHAPACPSLARLTQMSPRCADWTAQLGARCADWSAQLGPVARSHPRNRCPHSCARRCADYCARRRAQ